MNYDSKLQNMSWFCYKPVNMLSKTRMTTQQSYNKTLSSSGQDPSSRISKSLRALDFFSLNKSISGLGARSSYGTKMISLTYHRILCTCMIDLGWYQRKQKQSFSNSRRQLTTNAHELRRSHFFHPNIYFMNQHEENAFKKFPTLAGCSTRVMEKVAELLMGSTTIHPGFHGDGIP